MESSETIQSERLGAVLVEKNLITEEQLERALVLQEESGKRLGEILVAEFGVSRLEVAGVLSEQWAGAEKPEPEGSRPVEPLTPAEVRLRRPLGELLVMRGFITADQLDAALEEQRRSGARIGEILVERGAISRLDLAAAISDYGSSAGGLRSPGHAAGQQPSHDGSPGASSSAQGWSADGLALVSDLEARLQTLERAAGGAPWQEDLRLVAFDIRAAISVVEARLDAVGPSPGEADLVAALGAVSSRIDALENVPVAAELEALRQEFEGLKAGPVTMEEIADLRATVERLEALPDRADEIPRLASEIAVLAARSDEFAVRVEGLALPVAGLAPRIDGLAARVEEVAAAIPVVETDGLVARIELLEEGSRSGGGTLEQLAAEVAALASRLAEVPDAGQLSGRLEAVAERAELAQTGVAGLSGRVDELAASVPSGRSSRSCAVSFRILPRVRKPTMVLSWVRRSRRLLAGSTSLRCGLRGWRCRLRVWLRGLMVLRRGWRRWRRRSRWSRRMVWWRGSSCWRRGVVRVAERSSSSRPRLPRWRRVWLRCRTRVS